MIQEWLKRAKGHKHADICALHGVNWGSTLEIQNEN